MRRQPFSRFQLFNVESLESRLVMSAVSLLADQPPAAISGLEAGLDLNNWCGTTAAQLASQPEVNARVAATSESPELAPSIDQAVFTLKAPAMVIDSGIQLSDPDSLNFSTGKLTVTITEGAVKTDKLGIFSLGVGVGQVSVKKSIVLFEEVPVATFTGGKSGKPLVVTFDADATVDAVQAVTQAVTFSASGKAVTPARTVQFQITDGEGGTSDPVTVDVSLELLANRGKGPAVFGGTDGRSDDDSEVLDAETRHRAEQLTSAFEHSTVELQFASIHNDKDGRGFTAGFAGFTTGTGDFLEVVQQYSDLVPGNLLEQYLPQLETVVGTDSVKGLKGIEAAWREAATDEVFRQVQEEVNAKNSFEPAVESWRALELTSNLSLAALIDAAIQHGPGQELDDAGYADGLAVMIDRASARTGGTPADGVDESAWLSNFLQVRRESLAYAVDPTTRKAWAEAVERVDVYRDLLADGNLDLTGPITFHVYGDEFETD